MAQADPRIKNLRIKTGVVKRIAKEKDMYQREGDEIEKKIATMEEEKKDEYDIKKQKEVLQESRQMVPDSLKRLRKAHAELEEQVELSEDLEEAEEFKTAKEILENTRPALEC